MANTGQIVAALAGGALLAICTMLLAICTMLLAKVRAYERRAEQQRRIDSVVAAVLAGVETMRRDWPPDADTPTGVEAAVEVRARAHLRLIAMQPASKPTSRRGATTRSAHARPRSRLPRR